MAIRFNLHAVYDISDAIDKLAKEVRPARSTNDLVDLMRLLNLKAGACVLDAGSRDGRWSTRLRALFGFGVVALDLAPARAAGSERARPHGIPG